MADSKKRKSRFRLSTFLYIIIPLIAAATVIFLIEVKEPALAAIAILVSSALILLLISIGALVYCKQQPE